jgi:hypothetical protein
VRRGEIVLERNYAIQVLISYQIVKELIQPFIVEKFLSEKGKSYRRARSESFLSELISIGVRRGVSKWVEDACRRAIPETAVSGVEGRPE